MGRHSRQQRRAQARRQAAQPQRRRIGWQVITAAAIIAALVGLIGSQFFKSSGTSGTASARKIDGIGCMSSEQLAYHVHAHLSLFDRGHPITVPPQIGQDIDHDCIFWLHTHDATGVIHIEAPKGVQPTLGAFYDIWGELLSWTRIFEDAKVKPGEELRAYVNQKRYNGDPRGIRLKSHTDITLEIGPPFKPPVKFKFPSGS